MSKPETGGGSYAIKDQTRGPSLIRPELSGPN